MSSISKTISVIATFAIVSITHAAPSVSVTRTPSSGTVWDAYSVSWNAAWASKIGYRCSGAWNGSQDDLSSVGLRLNGTVTGKYDESMAWSTTCVWTATSADGSTATATETFSAKKKVWSVFESFAVSKIAGTPYAGSSVALESWARSFKIEGVGAPGANVIVSSAGCVYLNQSANSDGSWAVTVSDSGACKLPESGAFQFSVTASKAYAGEAVRYATVTFPSASTAEMGKIQCRTGGEYTETNLYAKRGESVTCTVSARDGKTRLMMNSGYVSWGDVESTKSVEPVSVSEIATSCQAGACSAAFVSDHQGYSKTRHVWFQNSAGVKSSTVSYVSADPASKDYADAVAYQKKKYRSSEDPSAASGGQSGQTPGEPASNGTVGVGSVTWAKYSNGKITATEGQSFAIAGTAAKRSQLRMYRKGADSDGVSAGSDDSGKWSLYGLSSKWHPRVLKTGTHQYVVESVSADGKFKSATTVEIEIVPAGETKPAPVTASDSPSVGNASNGNSSPTSGGPVKSQAPTPKISSALKTKLDAFVSVLEEKARAKWDAKASREYVASVRAKLVALKTKYRKTGKTASAAAIAYLIERADEVSEKFAQPLSEEESLIKDLKESY